MNSKLRKILRDVTLGALVGIIPNGKADASIIGTSIDERLSLLSNNDFKVSTNRSSPVLRYAYNYATDDGTFHRSHRSHSSHRSHYSSSSGGSGTTPTNAARSTNTYNVVNQNQNAGTVKPITVFSLGDRTLKKGIQGPDVLELKRALVKAKCYKMGEYEILDDIFDQKTLEAVNCYKKSHQLPEDGIVNTIVFYHLKNE